MITVTVRRLLNNKSSLVLRVCLSSRRQFSATMEILDEASISSLCKKLVPALALSRHKGQAGRIGVIGGSFEYTGAPYFAGITALKVGADLTHVFCTREAAPVIKSYSPELIVHPLLDAASVQNAIQWLDRLHVIVIGPGLGRQPDTFEAVSILINECRKLNKPLVIDADGLYLITEKPELIKNYPADLILTPNQVEFTRLQKSPQLQSNLIGWFGPKCVIIKKGMKDEIFDNVSKVQCSFENSGRRCGGQGDLLSGSVGTFCCWAQDSNEIDRKLRILTACYAGCKLTRICHGRAFKKLGRSMTCSDMIAEIGAAFQEHFENK